MIRDRRQDKNTAMNGTTTLNLLFLYIFIINFYNICKLYCIVFVFIFHCL